MRFAIACTARGFVHRNLHLHLQGKGNPGNSLSPFSHCGFRRRERAFSGLSDDYREILRNGLRDVKLDDAVDLFSEMVQSRPRLPFILINCFCRSSQLPLALAILGKMMKLGYELSIVTLSSLLNDNQTNRASKAFFESGGCENAQQVFKQMVSGGVPPNIMTYNIVLDGLCNNGKLEKALVIFQDLQKSEMKLNIVTYVIVINGMFKAGKVEEAWDLFSSIGLKGVMKPDVVTYTTMISGFCGKGLKQEADALFIEMKEDGPLPDSGTLTQEESRHEPDFLLVYGPVRHMVSLKYMRYGFNGSNNLMLKKWPSLLNFSIETFIGLGFSRDEFESMLKRFPHCIGISGETVKNKTEFLVKQMYLELQPKNKWFVFLHES
ncbi:unnamed protein product [Thlaspi arvense]|uniref:Pentatricopeptide repeat-containing protein n=1 Tax=Thlaspi arvense TaxID=13288 RepID=A0AAU9RQJ9_THLAR|nr:unnamed protein product [Thlaspi arvense]